MSDQARIVLKGRIKCIKDAVVIKNFEKREMWLEEQDVQYPQTYLIEFTQGDCNALDGFQVGQTVECHINLRGRYWSKDDREGVMNSLHCWRIKKLADAVNEPDLATEPATTDHGYIPAPSSDDLPF